jgi:hypothetical protein
MTIIIGKTHHMALTDGKDTIGLICVDERMTHDPKNMGRNPVEQSSLKTSSGNQKYDDLKPPYMKLAQSDWSGGRGSIEFELDVTRFFDSLRANTERSGKIIMGGRDVYSGLGTFAQGTQSLPVTSGMKLVALVNTKKYLAIRFQANATPITQIWAWLRTVGAPGNLTVKLCSDNSGALGSVLQTATVTAANMTKLVSELCVIPITFQTVTVGGYYWLQFYGGANDNQQNHWEVGCKQLTETTYESSTGTEWTVSNVSIYFRALTTLTDTDGHLFMYKNSAYYVTRPVSGAPKLYRNGVRGMAISNAGELSKLKAQGAPGWAANELAGGVVWVYAGTGSTEEQNWRIITGNGSDYILVDSDWKIAHDTTTEFVVVGVEKWVEITGHGLTAPVTDVLVSSAGFVYFAQGEAANIIRMKEEASAGVWTTTFADDGTTAIFLDEYNNPVTGAMNLVKTNGNTTVSAAVTPTTWTNASWTVVTGKAVGDSWDRITGTQRYVDSSQDEVVWIFKESVPWLLKNTTLDRAKLPELETIRSFKNGYASCVLGSYMFLSIQNSVHKFFHPTMDDVGPTLGEGLPAERQGRCVKLIPYPGRVFAAYDAGDGKYSHVLANNGGSSWHEIYRAPKGQRIHGCAFQVIPGSKPDRLWILQGGEIVWIPYPSDDFDPEHDANYLYTHEAVVEIAPMYAGLKDAYKFWKNLKMEAAYLQDGICWIEADYRLDDEEEYTKLPNNFTEMPMSESEFEEEFGVSGKKLQIRVRMYSTDISVSAKLLAVIVGGVTVVEPKFYYTAQVYITDRDLNNMPEDDGLTPKQKIQKLDEWTGTARPLKMYHQNPLYDNKKVFLMPLPNRPKDMAELVNEYTYVTTIVVQEA